MNPVVLLLTLVIAYSGASPTDYANSKSSSYALPTVAILKQINQHNEDGSYTFGYTTSDGSFRIENMDANGYVTGKYGYVDSNGQLQETEYVAGKVSGQSVGFQARGSSDRSSQTFPVVRTAVRSAEQKALDYAYSSVDDNEDGFPDVTPADSNRDVNIRVDLPAQNSYVGTPTAVRTVVSHADIVSDVRGVTPTKISYQTPIGKVATELSKKSSYSPSNAGAIRVADQTGNSYDKITAVRTGVPIPVPYEQVVVGERNRKTASYGNVQATIKQTVQPSKIFKQPDVNVPQTGYVESAVQSTSQLDEFLNTLKTNGKDLVNKGYNSYEPFDTIVDQDEIPEVSNFQIQEVQPTQNEAIIVDSVGFSSVV